MPMTRSSPRLHFEQWGDGEPVLLITGFAASSTVYEPLVELWSTRFRCITYDHPGTGRSSKLACPASTGQLAVGAIRVLDELGVRTAHIAGLSLGGAVALELALRFPERVRSLILASASADGPLYSPPNVRKLLLAYARVLTGSARRRRVWLAPALFAPGFAEREPEVAATLTRLLLAHPAAPWALAGQYAAAARYNRARDLARVKAPTLVLHGGDDVLVSPANARRLAAGIPDAELHMLAPAGHGLPYEQPQAVLRIVGDWVGRIRYPP
jgi:pimeloyl-ACP methyl ester carboxylesterase